MEKKILTPDLVHAILSAVDQIPAGKVASYGQIASLIGRPWNARLVGRVLSMAVCPGQHPCHRVLNHAGRTAPEFHEQRDLLESEGVVFLENGKVDMSACQWQF